MRRLLIASAAMILPYDLSGFPAHAQVVAPPTNGDPSGVLTAILIGGLMGMLGQGVRAIVGFRAALDAISASGPSQQDEFQAARLVVSLLVGFIAGVAATFALGVASVAHVGLGDTQLLLGLAAAGYAGTDFIEGFFSQYFKNPPPPPPVKPAADQTNSGVETAAPGNGIAAGPTIPLDQSVLTAQVGDVQKSLADLHAILPSITGSGTLFQQLAPEVMQRLMQDFGFGDFQAAGILGNIGGECGGFIMMQERLPIAGRGGYGWCQWTGPRRVAFEAYCKTNNVSVDSFDGNYGYLKHDLENDYQSTTQAVLASTTLEDAVMAFLKTFERPAVLAPAPRINWARIALKAYQAARGH